MQLQAKELLERRKSALLEKRSALKKAPGLAHIWVGDDHQTELFVKVKQNMAKELACDFYPHHFIKSGPRQLKAVIDGLNRKKEINGIILQLPLPKNLNTTDFIDAIALEKDVDGLKEGSPYVAPTAAGIVELLKENKIDLAKSKTMIIGAGKLVGAPLAKIFKENCWPFQQIIEGAEKQAAEIAKCNLVISCTGVEHLITPEMLTKETILVDGSGVDVDVKKLEPFVKMITPSKGAVGPLTVSFLYENLLAAAG